MTQIRLARVSDAAEIQAIYAPIVQNTVISFELEVPTVAEIAQRLEKYLEFAPWLVLEQDGEIWGYVYASRYRERAAYQWSVDVSAYVHEKARGKGVGTALYSALFKLLELQGFHQAFAGITLPNPASVGLHESLGFRPIGIYRSVGYKRGSWHDVGWWQKTLQGGWAAPKPLLSLLELQALPQWEAALEFQLA